MSVWLFWNRTWAWYKSFDILAPPINLAAQNAVQAAITNRITYYSEYITHHIEFPTSMSRRSTSMRSVHLNFLHPSIILLICVLPVLVNLSVSDQSSPCRKCCRSLRTRSAGCRSITPLQARKPSKNTHTSQSIRALLLIPDSRRRYSRYLIRSPQQIISTRKRKTVMTT